MNHSIDNLKFWSTVDKKGENECWNWTGNKSGKIGEFYLSDGGRVYAHHFSYILHFKQNPNVPIKRSCNNLLCVNPNHFRITTTIKDALYQKVNPMENGCHIYTGTINSKGYGVVYFEKKRYYAHRLNWELNFGSIPTGKIICHRCDNPLCVNIDHLFLGTPQDNSTDMVNKGRQSKGSDKRNAKLTESDVIKIKYRMKNFSPKEIAQVFGIHEQHVRAIIKGKYWKHI